MSIIAWNDAVLSGNQTRQGAWSNQQQPASGARAHVPIRGAGKLRRLVVHVNANTLSSAATLTVLVDGAPTALSVVIGASSTGYLTELVTEHAIGAGNHVVTYEATVIGAGGQIRCTASVEYIPST